MGYDGASRKLRTGSHAAVMAASARHPTARIWLGMSLMRRIEFA
jgi:hypothetical protein